MKAIIDDNYFCDASQITQVKYSDDKSLFVYFNNDTHVVFRHKVKEIIDDLLDFLNNDKEQFDVREYEISENK